MRRIVNISMRVRSIDIALKNVVLQVAIEMIHVEPSEFSRYTTIRYTILTGSYFPVSYSHLSDRKLMTNRPTGVTSYPIGLNPSRRNCDSCRYMVQLHRHGRVIRSTCAAPFCIPVAIVTSVAEMEVEARNSFLRNAPYRECIATRAFHKL